MTELSLAYVITITLETPALSNQNVNNLLVKMEEHALITQMDILAHVLVALLVPIVKLPQHHVVQILVKTMAFVK